MAWRCVLLAGALWFWPSMAGAATLYWVGEGGASVVPAVHWNLTRPDGCGRGDAAAAPGPSDELIFHATCGSSAIVDVDMAVAGLTMESGYAGTVRQQPGTTMMVGHFTRLDGVFQTQDATFIIDTVAGAAASPAASWAALATDYWDIVIATALALVAMVALIGTLAALPVTSSKVLANFVRNFLPFLSPLMPRRRPVGRVINEADGTPLKGALIHVFDVTTNRLRETIVSGADGTFGTILPSGTYLFSARKPDYAPVFTIAAPLLFPGEQLATNQPIVVATEGTVIPLVFVMRRVLPARWLARWRSRVVRLARMGQVTLARASGPLLLVGAALNVVALVRHPSLFSYGISLVYLVLLCFELIIARHFRKTIGWVFDAWVKQPVALASIRLVEAATKRIVQTRVTTAQGQYLLLAPRGEYRLQFAHPDYQPFERVVSVRLTGSATVAVDAALMPRELKQNALDFKA